MPNTDIERKLSALQAWVVAGLSFMVVAAFSSVFAVALIVTNKVNERAHKSDQALACYIQPQIDRSLKSLPTLAYYKSHPQELKQAVADIEQSRDRAIEAWGICEGE